METSEKLEIPVAEKGEKGLPAFSPAEPEVSTSRTIYLDPLGKELFPTPTVDPLDPLNWPKWRKYICIAIVMYMYFLFTYLFPLLPSDQSQIHHDNHSSKFYPASGAIPSYLYSDKLDTCSSGTWTGHGASLLVLLCRYLWPSTHYDTWQFIRIDSIWMHWSEEYLI